jgi:hypothetical protein
MTRTDGSRASSGGASSGGASGGGASGGASGPMRITLLGKPGCHLCDDARAVIARVAADLNVAWEERDITASAAETAEYWDKIPVTLVDGVQHDFWRVSEDRLRAALRLPGSRAALSGKPRGAFRRSALGR